MTKGSKSISICRHYIAMDLLHFVIQQGGLTSFCRSIMFEDITLLQLNFKEKLPSSPRFQCLHNLKPIMATFKNVFDHLACKYGIPEGYGYVGNTDEENVTEDSNRCC